MGSQSRTRLSKRTTANIVTCYVVGVYETHLGIPDSAGAGLSEVELLHCSFWPSITTLRLSTVYECVPFQLLIFFFFLKTSHFEMGWHSKAVWAIWAFGLFLILGFSYFGQWNSHGVCLFMLPWLASPTTVLEFALPLYEWVKNLSGLVFWGTDKESWSELYKRH